MHDTLPGSGFLDTRKMQLLFLALLSFTGLLTGVCFGFSSGESFASLMRSHDFSAVSIVSLAVSSLPFLISAFAVISSRRLLLFAVLFVKAFCYGFSAICCFIGFRCAGWLIFSLVFFSDLCLYPVLYWFALRYLMAGSRTLRKDLVICTIFLCMVGGLNQYMISPLLARLI